MKLREEYGPWRCVERDEEARAGPCRRAHQPGKELSTICVEIKRL